MGTAPDAATIAGMLADADRRRVFAALVLGAVSVDQVVEASGLAAKPAVAALERLAGAGLVIDDGGKLHVAVSAFAAAARRAAAERPATAAPEGATEDETRILRSFVHDGRLASVPVQRSKRLVVFDHLAQQFEPGRRYSEQAVNLMLGQWYADTAALRRFLVEDGFLDRKDGVYWRSGGTVDPPPDCANPGPT
jgi:hypothetical protein